MICSLGKVVPETPSIPPCLPARAVVIVTIVLTAGIACRSTRPPVAVTGAAVAPAVEFLAAFVLPPPPTDAPRRLGSFSSLARDERTGRYLAVIDDRQPSRIAWLEVRYEGGRLTVSPIDVQPVVAGAGVDRRRVTAAELEGVAALPDGTFVAVEEGHRSTGAPGQPPAGEWPVALLTLSPAMTVTRIDDWPAMFDIGAARGGIRDNQGAEGLTRTPDGRLIAGLEQPRYADRTATERRGRPFGGGAGGPGRLVEFVAADGGWRARRQWLYPIAPTALRPGFDTICDDGENGLTELLALDDARFLTLERACLRGAQTPAARNTGHLYYVDAAGADDVSRLPSLASARVRGVAKTLLLDFDALIPLLPPELSQLDNFEGMAFGPTLPDGRRTVLVVSDDNFRPTQHTVFLLFRIG